jgi:hypothetical protein
VFLKFASAVIGNEKTIYLPSGYGIFYREEKTGGSGF